ncbi:MBL fold metallo-hydrolase [Deinococcus fonticola]|uniref:MBL fold metallo-hydrolase n=1 Tax=Deinococcus fonticola TaxID=2528713 RepID=UPI001074DCB7|nr:MBL fold metallo-hydrolase [Deinococcus fonticola]
MSEVHTIDLMFQETPGVIAAFVFDTGDGLAVVDTGPTSTLGVLEEGLGKLGAGLGDVRHLLLTHIHFDHAGAAGSILEKSRKARVYVHEKGAPHLVNPEKLLASATQIYGDQMDTLWGEMKPMDADRVTALTGGEGLKLGHADIHALYTPGHAVHHLAYHSGDDLFTGDVGGIRLLERQTPRAPTPPPDINLALWRESIERLRQLDARTLHLAHFGRYPQSQAHWDGLLQTMQLDAERVREPMQQGRDFAYIKEQFTETLLAELADEDAALPELYEFACPPWMSVQGLMRYWTRQAARSAIQGGQA